MNPIREVFFETSDARIIVGIFPNRGQPGFTADYYGYTFQNTSPMPIATAVSMPKEIYNGNLKGAHLEKLVDKCRTDIEKRFGNIISTQILDRAPAQYLPMAAGTRSDRLGLW